MQLSLARGRAGAQRGRRSFGNRPKSMPRAVALSSRQIRTILKANSRHPGDSLMNLEHANRLITRTSQSHHPRNATIARILVTCLGGRPSSRGERTNATGEAHQDAPPPSPLSTVRMGWPPPHPTRRWPSSPAWPPAAGDLAGLRDRALLLLVAPPDLAVLRWSASTSSWRPG